MVCAQVVVDLALAATSRAAIEVAVAAGAPLRPGDAVDAHGVSTIDAEAALAGAQLPAGGVKGALLALLVEVLAGGLTGSDLAPDSNDYHTMNRGLFLLAVDPASTRDGAFDVERLLERFGGKAGAGARERRAAAARGDGDLDVNVRSDVWFDLKRRGALGDGSAADVEAVLSDG